MRAILVYFLYAAMSLIAGCATLPENYLALQSRETSSLDEILLQAGDKQVIFVGEAHGFDEYHLVQFEVVRRLHEKGKAVAIALEMFPSEAQAVLDKWVGGKLSEDDFVRAYYSVWRVPYEYYSDAFEYARRFRIPLVGINGNESMINNVAKNGIGNLPDDFRRAVRVSSCDDAPQYRRMVDRFESRTGHTAKMPFFCDAQRLRDSIMAYNIMRVLERGGFTVVVLVGSIHALKPAVPDILFSNYNVASSVILSKEFVDIVSSGPDTEVADYVWY